MTEAERAQSRRMILVLDDEPMVVSFLVAALRTYGYEAIVATNCDAARSLFNRHAVNLALIIAEIALPRITGPEFINSLPTLEPRIPVIFLTCLGEQEITLKPLDCPTPVLRKPVTSRDLRAAIQRVAIQ
jgi:DNA-binding response OmpR family regulator